MASVGVRQTRAAVPPDIGDWIRSFKTQRKRVEQGICERLSDNDRGARLEEADNALPGVDFPDFDCLDVIADRLEQKLQEMLRAALLNGNSTQGARLPPDFDPGHALETLRLPVAQDERSWLFRGGIMEILYRFRDQGKALILKERNRLLKSLSSRVRRLEDVIGELNAHPVVTLALDAEEMQRIDQCLEAARAITLRYEAVLTSSDAGVASLLENNYYQLQGQFAATCAQLCFRLYGNVSNEHLTDLLRLKGLGVLNCFPDDARIEAERKHLERKRDLALRQVLPRAEKESWPTWPLLQLYNYDERFGRRPPSNSPRNHDGGLASVEAPTDRAGTPLI